MRKNHSKKPNGWYYPNYSNTVKAHYHNGNDISLCKRFGTLGSKDSDFYTGEMVININILCATCKKKLESILK